MARGYFNYMMILMHGLLLCDSTLILKSEHILHEKNECVPKGTKGCRELCQSFDDSFSPMKEYHCQQNLTKGPFTCFVRKKTVNGLGEWVKIAGQDNCKTEGSAIANLTGHQRSIALLEACDEGDLCLVKYIVTHGLADINCRDKFGRTPAITAAKNGHVSVLNFLVSQDCDLTAVTRSKENALHVACAWGFVDIVRKLFVLHEFDLEQKGRNGMTPLMYAAKFGHEKVFEFLVRKGCNVNAVDNFKNNILHLASVRGNLIIVNYIISNKLVNIDSRGINGMTSAMLAVQNGHKRIINFLVSKGCNQKMSDDSKDNILHLACSGRKPDLVQYILSKGVLSIESKGYHGRTPLITAAVGGDIKIVNLLMSKGCNTKALDDYGNNVLHAASYSGLVHMVKYILDKGIAKIESRGFEERTPCMLAAEFGKRNVLAFLIRRKCNLNAVDLNGNSVLHAACYGGDIKTVMYLMTLKDVEKQKRNNDKMTAEDVARSAGHAEIVSLLQQSS